MIGAAEPLQLLKRMDIMQQKQNKIINKKNVITSIAVLSAITVGGYEVNELSADPIGEKNCPPAFAENATMVDTQVNVAISPLSLGDRLKWVQKGGTINDISCLDRTPVFGIVQVSSIEDIKTALAFAR